MVDQRRYNRAPINVTVEIAPKGEGKPRFTGQARDISIGGMFVETPTPLEFRAELVVHLTLPGHNAPFALPGVVRWKGTDGMGIQFLMIGARETHAITEATKDHTR